MIIRNQLNIILIALFLCTGCKTIITTEIGVDNTLEQINPIRTLTICLGYEPESLYLYSAHSQSAWAVLEAIYDGPIDTVNYESHPIILKKMPSFEDGDAIILQKEVKTGEPVINSYGEPVPLAPGQEVLPSGCYQKDCAITWDGNTSLTMDYMEVTYKIRDDILWSDAIPLTIRDSIYSYEVQADVATPGIKTNIFQTQSYQALNDYQVKWTGKPGFITQQFEKFFWIPLPAHAWKNIKSQELPSAEISSRYPLGWGAYILREWQPGSFIRLIKNPLYFRANEGLPKFEQIIFTFLNQQGDANIKGIQHTKCDFANQTILTLDQSAELDTLLNYYSLPELKASFGQGPLSENLIFNTSQADSRSDNYFITHQFDIRQAIAYCVNRPKINKELFNKLAEIPLTYAFSVNQPRNNDLNPYEFNREKGMQILELSGWIDKDHDSTTPRVSKNVDSIPDGTPLILKLILSMDQWEEKAAILIKESLAECGIGVNLELLQENEFFNPQGPFFQSNFDLALFGWMSGAIPPCYLFSRPAQEILSGITSAIDLNVSGFNNPEYDALCKASLQPLVTEEDQRNLQKEMQSILNRDLPFLPLFTYYQADIARNDFCPYELDISARSDLQNIESMDYGDQCLP